jgi:PAS domain-containing protein
VERLKRLILGSEDELVRRVMELARKHVYAQLVPAFEDDYRAMIASVSANLVQSLSLSGDVPELRATDDLATDAIASLGDRMARVRRGDAADVQLTLGLLKRYRQAYLDIVRRDGLPAEEMWLYCGVVDRFFDRFELGYVGRWCSEAPGAVPKAIIDRSRELSAESARFLTVFADLPIPVILVDGDGRVENINTAAAILFAPAGRRHLRLGLGPVRRDPPPILLDEIEAFRAGPERETFFERELKTGKGTRHFEVRFNKMRGADASDTGTLVSLNDLTYRRHAEDALRRSQAKYASLFENMLTGFAYTQVVLDRRNRPVDYTFLEVNAAFERITGLESRQIIGRRLTAVMPGIGSDEADWMGSLGRVALTGETASFDACLAPVARWCSVSVYSPAPGHVTLMLSDISGPKSIPESLRRNREASPEGHS